MLKQNSFLLVFLAVQCLFQTSVHASSRDLRFANACQRGKSVVISAVGDVLIHRNIQVQGLSQQGGFSTLWHEAIPYFQAADVSYANLEGPAADGVLCSGELTNHSSLDVGRACGSSRGIVYSGYPKFNYHSSLVSDLKRSGIDIVSTANNHSLDRHSNGVLQTINALDRAGLAFTGTREGQGRSRPWYRLTRVKGKNIAWLACTFGTNGIPDSRAQVLPCFSGNHVARIVSQLRNQVDAVIVTPHWGYEYASAPNSQQRSYAQAWLNAGATAVIGSHPHVLQPWEKHVTPDGRETLIVYSLGNFVSSQVGLARRTSAILYLGLTFSGRQTFINGVRYVPTHMVGTKYGQTLFVNSVHRIASRNQILSQVASAFGTERILMPGERLTTNPECH